MELYTKCTHITYKTDISNVIASVDIFIVLYFMTLAQDSEDKK